MRGATPRFHRAHLLFRHPALLDETSHQELRELLAHHEDLRIVVSFRDRMIRIWNETSSSHARALVQLRELCHDAAISGVPALRRFAERVGSYALPAIAERASCPA
jgi:hypothetical protein